MINWTFIFLILALVAGVLGFTSLAGAVGGIAQILCILFICLSGVYLISQESVNR
ncbi:MAG: DUF1328 domain-containing protein [Verrucomicrobiota bacterium]